MSHSNSQDNQLNQPISQSNADHESQEMRALRHISRALGSELNFDRLLQKIITEVTPVVNAERSTFYIVDQERGELWSKIAQKAEIKEIRLPIGKGIAGYVAETGQTINIKDAYNDSRFDSSTDKKTGYKTRTVLCMPIFEPQMKNESQPSIIGVLQCLNKKDGVFTENDEQLISNISYQIAIALINSRLYMSLEKRVDELNLLYNVETDLVKAYDIKELLQLIVDKIQDALQVEAVILSLIDEKNNKFQLRVAHNVDLSRLEDARINEKSGLTGRVINTGEMYVNNQAQDDPLLSDKFRKKVNLNIQQIVSVPLKNNHTVIGVLELFNKTEENEFFRNDDVRIIQSLSGQISRTIENYRLRDEKERGERMATIGNMMSTIVHDLRTPMSNIYGFVDLMEIEDEQNKRQQYAQIVTDQIKMINNMANDVLQFAKGKTSILPVKKAVDKFLEEFANRFKDDVESKGYRFEIENHSHSSVYIDPEKANRIFMNIMKNSMEAMEKGGRFSITANDLSNEVEFILNDTGGGIPEDIREDLFESFVTSGKENGTGLGLAIVKDLIDQHKGRIEVESEMGKGTAFKLYFKKL
ncbi:MAG: GAF domain-containing protein [Caldithrix sp.]|nr:GAF domain-containing protein [Caldithrix sp.]